MEQNVLSINIGGATLRYINFKHHFHNIKWDMHLKLVLFQITNVTNTFCTSENFKFGKINLNNLG